MAAFLYHNVPTSGWTATVRFAPSKWANSRALTAMLAARMFIGHYAPALALKPAAREVPLWALFVAVQLLDFGWDTFVLVGWEHFRIVAGFTASNDLDLYDMPWTHSLAAALVWSAVAALVAWRVWSARSAWVIGIAVLSHWLLDMLVHAGDLTLAGNDTMHVGFGLWNQPTIEIAIEISTVVVGGVIASRAVGDARARVLALTALLVAFAAIERVMPPPASVTQLVLSAFASYVVLALAAWWTERVPTLRR